MASDLPGPNPPITLDTNVNPDIPWPSGSPRGEGVVPKPPVTLNTNVNPHLSWPEGSPYYEPVPVSEAFHKGAQQATEELFMPKTAAGLAKTKPHPPSWIEEGLQDEDFMHPASRLAPKFLYQMGEYYPEWLAGSAAAPAGAAIGTALMPGAGTVAGTGIAIGLSTAAMHYAHKISPIYQRELEASPDDPDAAFNRAWLKAGYEAGITGLISGVTGGVNPFKSATKNVLLHGATQPAINVAGQAGYNVATGEPWNKNLVDVAGESLLNTIPLTGAYLGAKGAAGTAKFGYKTWNRAIGNEMALLNDQVPSAAKIKQTMNDYYGTMEKEGNIPNLARLTSERNGLYNAMIKARGDPARPGDDDVFNVVERMDRGRGKNNPPPDVGDLLNKRSEFSNLIGKGGNTARLAALGRDYIDTLMQDEQRLQGLGFDSSAAKRIARSAQPAREFAFLYHQLGEYMDMYNDVQAKSQGDSTRANKLWQKKFHEILSDPDEYVKYSPEVREGMQRVIDNAEPGWFDIANLPKPFQTAGIGLHLLADLVGGSGAGMGLSGMLMAKEFAKGMRTRGLVDQANEIENIIKWQAMPKHLRPVMTPPAKRASPYLELMKPASPNLILGDQQQARGGRVSRALRVAHQCC